MYSCNWFLTFHFLYRILSSNVSDVLYRSTVWEPFCNVSDITLSIKVTFCNVSYITLSINVTFCNVSDITLSIGDPFSNVSDMTLSIKVTFCNVSYITLSPVQNPICNVSDMTLSVRDPFSSVLAEYNRRAGGHIGHAGPDKFRRENAPKWREFVLRKGRDWEAMNLDWALAFPGPKHVVFYDELVNSLEPQLRQGHQQPSFCKKTVTQHFFLQIFLIYFFYSDGL